MCPTNEHDSLVGNSRVLSKPAVYLLTASASVWQIEHTHVISGPLDTNEANAEQPAACSANSLIAERTSMHNSSIQSLCRRRRARAPATHLLCNLASATNSIRPSALVKRFRSQLVLLQAIDAVGRLAARRWSGTQQRCHDNEQRRVRVHLVGNTKSFNGVNGRLSFGSTIVARRISHSLRYLTLSPEIIAAGCRVGWRRRRSRPAVLARASTERSRILMT